MNGMMKVVTLNGGRYVGLPKHIAARVEEATKYRVDVDGTNLVMEVIERDAFKRATCTTIRNRTAYDDQRWFRLPKGVVDQLEDDFWAVGKQVVVSYTPSSGKLEIRATGRDA